MRSIIDFLAQRYVPITIIILAMITFFSLLPLPRLPELPGTDKLHHFVAYALLMLPTAVRKPKYWIYAGIGFVLWSGVIELVQPMVNRYGEWLDLFANAGGVAIGASIGLLLGILQSRRSKAN